MKKILGLTFLNLLIVGVIRAHVDTTALNYQTIFVNDYKCPKGISIQTCFADVIERNKIDNPCSAVFEAPESKDGSLWLKIRECGIQECQEGYRVIEGDPEKSFPRCCRTCERMDIKRHYKDLCEGDDC